MKTKPAAIAPAALLQDASDPRKTPFDYIVVGSGAGGGSLAARLALEGRRVLVIEAGVDPATGEKVADPNAAPTEPGPHGVREVYSVPAFNGASTEEPDISWDFSVRHFADRDRQKEDRKYFEDKDPSTPKHGKGAARGGIFYPRCAAVGGCTAHYAMIVVRPNDSDWDRIAKNTGDPTWRSENMQGYFAKLEDCLYYKVFRGFFGKLRWLFGLTWLFKLLNPRGQLEPGGHGAAGWQKTSFIHPALILGIVKTDWTFLRVLVGVVRAALRDKAERRRLLRALLRWEIVEVLDPNVRSPDFQTRLSRLSLIPVGTDGECRRGLREHLLEVASRHPDRLVLATGLHATRVLFEKDKDGVPRAVGVQVAEGTHLYAASPLSAHARGEELKEPPRRVTYFSAREVILSGGSFNTPQLLMLSGIGDAARLKELGIDGPRDAEGKPVAPIVKLPGVGANLQDRYEVSVISEMQKDFSVLRGASFRPGDRNDPILREWHRDKTGLYTTNGGAVAMMLSSAGNPQTNGEPDLFLFGLPAAFRGYYWGYSHELLSPAIRAPKGRPNLWTWLILKAYTHNNHGTVRLLSPDPFVPPEIIFNSFADEEGRDQDVAALCDGVRRVREVNRCIGGIAREIQPGPELADGSEKLAEWLQNQAWGHHACGTCRIGSDPWRSDVARLDDVNAVLDSKFRVHGVRALRVVDASVFPRIPGYFIVASVFMVGEKAADTLLADSVAYPAAFEAEEAAAVRARREIVFGVEEPAPASRLPQDTVGIALSGGGIRSATFCLGVLQSLARRKRLGDVDYMSTVSGGGFAGGFLGRLFTRLKDDVSDKVGRVQQIVADTSSPEIWWLRRNADYIASAGLADVETNVAIMAGNLASVYFFIGALLFAVFGGLRWISDVWNRRLELPQLTLWNIDLSFWWWVPVGVFSFAAVPLAIGHWLTPSSGKRYPTTPLLLWVALIGCALYGLSVPHAGTWSAVALGALLLAWVVQEATRWRVAYEGRSAVAEALAEAAPESVPNALVRNRIARALGAVLLGLTVSILWVVLDSLARRAAGPVTSWSMVGAAPVLLLLREAAMAWLKGTSGSSAAVQTYEWARKAIVAGIAFLFAAILLFLVDALAHHAFRVSPLLGAWTAGSAFVGSLIVGRWLGFLNLSSLQQAYGQKLVRTFLGASNDARVHPGGPDDSIAVEIPSAGDDVFFDEYWPERNGGPLHLINTTVNDTVASDSGRQLRDDKGLPMCVGPKGVSVGRRYHALWRPRSGERADRTLLHPLAVAPDPNAFHLLARSDGNDPSVERLRLGQWMGISGAAVSTGTGRFTSIPQALLLGLLNIRLGYWWDSGINAGRRPSRYPPNLWRRLKSAPGWFFRMQATLLNEWRGYFPGPAERLWYLTDGGHFDNTGLYELVRRRLPFVISVDGGEDQRYELDDLAVLTRQARLDFGAEIEWLDPTGPRSAGFGDWAAFDQAAAPFATVPPWIGSFVNPNALGTLTELRRDSLFCGALARVVYDGDSSRPTWLLLLKANLAPPLPIDVRNYAAHHPAFPNEPTADQFFKNDQWESYRALGQCAGLMVFRERLARRPAAIGGFARAATPSVPTTPAPSPTGPLLGPTPFVPATGAVAVRSLTVRDTLRVQWFVTIPSFLLGAVAARRWSLWLFSRLGAGRPTMRFLSELRERYGGEHFLTWFPVRKTLLVLARETMEAVLTSETNAADPVLKKRAVSRFAPESLVISSGGLWRDRRPFNEGALDFDSRLHRHHDAFTKIVLEETAGLAKPGARELGWSDFQTLGERISQQVILGEGEVKPVMGEQLTSLVACSNLLFRDTVNYPAFHGDIEDHLARPAPRCLAADSAEALKSGSATEATRVWGQVAFWLFVLRDALGLHVTRTLALIAAHPEVQQQARDEVANAGKLTADAIDSLRFLEACVHEQLRLWAPVPLLLRRATKPFALREEIPIEAEQQILMHAGFYHRDLRVFGEFADRFAPARLLQRAFPPTYFFSAHRQSCVGRPLVTFLLKATLASLLARHAFDLLGPDIDSDSVPYLYDHFSVKLKAR